MMKRFLWILIAMAGGIGCGREQASPHDLTQIPFRPQAFHLEEPAGFVRMVIPEDNPLTVEGVALGQQLFYDPILSSDSTVSCASCHLPQLAFTDARPVSRGVEGRPGRRAAPSLFNIGYYYKGLFWDGRVASLEEQAFHPVRDSMEMALGWEEAALRLKQHDEYPALFRQAFGIGNQIQIDSHLIAKALAQFQRTLISNDSKFDRMKRGEVQFSEAEVRGQHIFFDSSTDLPHSECVHCHADPLFTNLDFFNNGLFSPEEQITAADQGRYEVTRRASDRYKFRTPTLRNIAVTAPYMHDGRFATLEEVIAHYQSGGHFAENVNPNVRILHLTTENKADLIAFLHTLTDSVALTNPAYGNPFFSIQ